MLREMENSPSPSPAREVTHPEAARLLTDMTGLRYLEPFFGQPRTVSEAAAMLEVKPNSLLYRVRRFVELGLLTVVSEEARAGRAVKRYGTAAEAFFVPFAATDALTPEAWLLRWERDLQDQLVQSALTNSEEPPSTWGLRIGLGQDGLLNVYPASQDGRLVMFGLEADRAATLLGWNTGLYLDYPAAKAFQRELHDLILKYYRRGGAQQYVLRVALAPLPRQTVPPLFTI